MSFTILKTKNKYFPECKFGDIGKICSNVIWSIYCEIYCGIGRQDCFTHLNICFVHKTTLCICKTCQACVQLLFTFSKFTKLTKFLENRKMTFILPILHKYVSEFGKHCSSCHCIILTSKLKIGLK